MVVRKENDFKSVKSFVKNNIFCEKGPLVYTDSSNILVVVVVLM